MNLNPRVRDLWTSALVNESHRQGRKQLRSGREFCPLGVLCDLYADEHPGGEWMGVEFRDETGDQRRQFLPDDVIRWAFGLEGLPDRSTVEALEDPYLGVETVSERNDRGSSFKTIAHKIEQFL